MDYRHNAYPFRPVLEAALQAIIAEGVGLLEVMTFDEVAKDVEDRLYHSADFGKDPRRQAAEEILEGYLDREEALGSADLLDRTGNERATAWGYMVGGDAIRQAVAILWP